MLSSSINIKVETCHVKMLFEIAADRIGYTYQPAAPVEGKPVTARSLNGKILCNQTPEGRVARSLYHILSTMMLDELCFLQAVPDSQKLQVFADYLAGYRFKEYLTSLPISQIKPILSKVHMDHFSSYDYANELVNDPYYTRTVYHLLDSARAVSLGVTTPSSLFSIYATVSHVVDGLYRRVLSTITDAQLNQYTDNGVHAMLIHDFREYVQTSMTIKPSDTGLYYVEGFLGTYMTYFINTWYRDILPRYSSRRIVTTQADGTDLLADSQIMLKHNTYSDIDFGDILRRVSRIDHEMFFVENRNVTVGKPEDYYKFSIVEFFIEQKTKAVVSKLNMRYRNYVDFRKLSEPNSKHNEAFGLDASNGAIRFLQRASETDQGLDASTLKRIHNNQDLLLKIYKDLYKLNTNDIWDSFCEYILFSWKVSSNKDSDRPYIADKAIDTQRNTRNKEKASYMLMTPTPELPSKYCFTDVAYNMLSDIIICFAQLEQLNQILESYSLSIVDLPRLLHSISIHQSVHSVPALLNLLLHESDAQITDDMISVAVAHNKRYEMKKYSRMDDGFSVTYNNSAVNTSYEVIEQEMKRLKQAGITASSLAVTGNLRYPSATNQQDPKELLFDCISKARSLKQPDIKMCDSMFHIVELVTGVKITEAKVLLWNCKFDTCTPPDLAELDKDAMQELYVALCTFCVTTTGEHILDLAGFNVSRVQQILLHFLDNPALDCLAGEYLAQLDFPLDSIEAVLLNAVNGENEISADNCGALLSVYVCSLSTAIFCNAGKKIVQSIAEQYCVSADTNDSFCFYCNIVLCYAHVYNQILLSFAESVNQTLCIMDRIDALEIFKNNFSIEFLFLLRTLNEKLSFVKHYTGLLNMAQSQQGTILNCNGNLSNVSDSIMESALKMFNAAGVTQFTNKAYLLSRNSVYPILFVLAAALAIPTSADFLQIKSYIQFKEQCSRLKFTTRIAQVTGISALSNMKDGTRLDAVRMYHSSLENAIKSEKFLYTRIVQSSPEDSRSFAEFTANKYKGELGFLYIASGICYSKTKQNGDIICFVHADGVIVNVFTKTGQFSVHKYRKDLLNDSTV